MSNKPKLKEVGKNSAEEIVEKRRKADAWENLYTGLGVKGRDKRKSLEYKIEGRKLSDAELDDLYMSDGLAAKVVDRPAKDATRNWVETVVSKDDGSRDDDAGETLSDFQDNLLLKGKFLDALTWAFLKGGAIIVIGVDDGQDAAEPVNMDRIKSVRWAQAFAKDEIQIDQPHLTDEDPESPNFGMPLYYRTIRDFTEAGEPILRNRIHASRIIRFDGTHTTRRAIKNNGGWAYSVLERVYEALQSYHSTFDSASAMAARASQGVYRLLGLMDLIAAGKKQVIFDRLETMEIGRSISRALVLDMEESYEDISPSFAGLPEVLSKAEVRLAGGANIPMTLLFGISPAGMDATGESDIRLYYDEIKLFQERHIIPKLRRLFDYYFASAEGPTGGQIPPYTVTPNPLWQQTSKERAEERQIIANTDAVYIDRNVVLEQDVAKARFGPEGYSTELVADLDAMEQVRQTEADEAKLEKEIEAKLAKQMNPDDDGNDDDDDKKGDD